MILKTKGLAEKNGHVKSFAWKVKRDKAANVKITA